MSSLVLAVVSFGLGGLVMMAESGNETHPLLGLALMGASAADLLSAVALAWRYFRGGTEAAREVLVLGFALILGSAALAFLIGSHAEGAIWSLGVAALPPYAGAWLIGMAVWGPKSVGSR